MPIALLNDEDLRKELKKFGINPGPIAPTTRGLYLARLNQLQTMENGVFSQLNQSLQQPRAESVSKIPAPPRSTSRLALPRTRIPSTKRKSTSGNDNDENVPPEEPSQKKLKAVKLDVEPSTSTSRSKRFSNEKQIMKKRARRSIHKAKETLKGRTYGGSTSASSTRKVGTVAPIQRATSSTSRVTSIKKTTEPVRSSPRLKARGVSRATAGVANSKQPSTSSTSRNLNSSSTSVAGGPKKPKRDKWDLKGRLEDTKEELAFYKAQSAAIPDIERRLCNLESEKQNLVVEKTTLATTSTEKEQEISMLKTQVNSLKQEVQSKTMENQTLELKINSVTQTLELKINSLQTDLFQSKIDLDESKRNTLFEQQKVSNLKAETENLKRLHQDEIDAIKQTLQNEVNERNRLSSELASLKAENQTQKEELQDAEMERRKLLNAVQELKGNIRVFCRVRPMSATEVDEFGPMKHISFAGNSDKDMGILNDQGKDTPFSFDKVFKPCATQELVFEEVSMLIQSAMDGYNVCIFAYGQTGAGKTYTMEGPEESGEDHHGIIPRAVQLIFCRSEEIAKHGWEYQFELQHVEIYNDSLVDLLNAKPDPNKKLEIKTTSTSNDNKIWVKNLTSHAVNNIDQVNNLLRRSKKYRTTAATKANDRSSRSHAVFILKIKGKNNATGEEVSSDLNLIDLAGSERVAETGSQGVRLKEAQKINGSLSNLSQVISALANKGSHVPYRNSKLTFLLKDSLGGNSKTLMIVNVNPVKRATAETINTLRFATTVNKCNIGTAQKMVKF